MECPRGGNYYEEVNYFRTPGINTFDLFVTFGICASAIVAGREPEYGFQLNNHKKA